MIPDSDENGYLPPGVHLATLDEIEARFGREPEIRRVQFESLRWLVDLARRAGAERLVINGSFTTDADEPNDVDCVLLTGITYPNEGSAAAEIVRGLPFLGIQVVEREEFDIFVGTVFAFDRTWNPKGMVEVTLWT